MKQRVVANFDGLKKKTNKQKNSQLNSNWKRCEYFIIVRTSYTRIWKTLHLMWKTNDDHIPHIQSIWLYMTCIHPPPPSSFRCSTILCINAPSTIHHYKRPVHPIRHNLQSYPTHIPWFPTLFLYLSSIRQLPPVQQHYGLPHCVPGKNHYSKCGWWRRIQFDRCKTSAQLIQTKFKRPFVFIWRKCYWSIGTILQSESGL